MQGNKKTRGISVPFKAISFNYGNTSDTNEETIVNFPIMRFVKPYNMELIECYAMIKITATSDLSFKIFIGDWETGTITKYKAKTSYTNLWVDNSHRRLTGSDAMVTVASGNTELLEINLLLDLPKKGDSNYKDDGFVLGFSGLTNADSPDFEIEIVGSTLLGVK